MKIRQAGRPKIINREAVINIALTQYWEHGIENVSLTNIANLLKISRPTIYNEFSNEDNLIAEVIQKYINISAEPSDLNYDNFKQYPNHLFTHFKSNIYDNNKYLINNYTHHGIKRPEKAIGCFLQKSILNKYNFKSKSFNIINKYNIKRQKSNRNSTEFFKKSRYYNIL
jgi:AcrR family transcriptional regulator